MYRPCCVFNSLYLCSWCDQSVHSGALPVLTGDMRAARKTRVVEKVVQSKWRVRNQEPTLVSPTARELSVVGARWCTTCSMPGGGVMFRCCSVSCHPDTRAHTKYIERDVQTKACQHPFLVLSHPCVSRAKALKEVGASLAHPPEEVLWELIF